MIKHYLKEPLLHFLVLGALVFYAYSSINGGFEDEDKKITITQIKLDQLNILFKKKFLRTPTKEEQKQFINKAIYEEVMYREAVKLGLEKEDPIIRRRLVQKLEFLSENFIVISEPTTQELTQYLLDHNETFVEPAQISFYLIDHNNLKQVYNAQTPWDISRRFGRKFTEKMAHLEVGVLHKHINDTSGIKAVFIEQRVEGKVPKLEEIKSKVTQAYRLDKEIQLKKEFYENLKSSYHIEIGK